LLTWEGQPEWDETKQQALTEFFVAEALSDAVKAQQGELQAVAWIAPE
jgi:hypothetical protein